jgi:hypothetical protein
MVFLHGAVHRPPVHRQHIIGRHSAAQITHHLTIERHAPFLHQQLGLAT